MSEKGGVPSEELIAEIQIAINDDGTKIGIVPHPIATEIGVDKR
jgi:hypothetical protein